MSNHLMLKQKPFSYPEDPLPAPILACEFPTDLTDLELFERFCMPVADWWPDVLCPYIIEINHHRFLLEGAPLKVPHDRDSIMVLGVWVIAIAQKSWVSNVCRYENDLLNTQRGISKTSWFLQT